MENTIGNESSSTSLTCVVAGIPRPSVSWSSFNVSSGLQDNIVNDSVKYDIVETYHSGEQGLMRVRSELTVLNLSKTEDELYYRCDGSNNVTNLLDVQSTSHASLTVQGSAYLLSPVACWMFDLWIYLLLFSIHVYMFSVCTHNLIFK